MNPADLLQLSPLLADRARLAILATLGAAKDPLDFTTLLTQLGLSKGNLSSHLRRLEEGKLIRCTKEFINRKPRSTYVCTAKGRNEMNDYLTKVESLLRKHLPKK